MPTESSEEIVSTWFGAFLTDGRQIARESRFPPTSESWIERLRARREGRLCEEEEALAGAGRAATRRTRDRRFERLGVPWTSGRPERPAWPGPSWRDLRPLLLAEAEVDLRAAWDPSIHLDEAVRAMADLDRTRNLIGERLASWAARDRPDLPADEAEKGERATDAVLDSAESSGPSPVPSGDPALLEARRSLARSFRGLGELRRSLERAIEEAGERRMPNLARLLGPTLAARMVSQAGGLDRLARLPSSTVQVLGAEKAFFDHLRRGSGPPRHGLLFLHPAIQGAPRRSRGRLARALAGKVTIAARLDRAGRPVNEALLEAFRRRSEAVPGPTGPRPKPSTRLTPST